MSRLVSRCLVVAALAVGASGGAFAIAQVASFDKPATVTQHAERVSPAPTYSAVAYDRGAVDAEVVQLFSEAAASVQAVTAPLKVGSLGLRAVERSGQKVHGPPAGYLIPMIFSAFPASVTADAWGDEYVGVFDNETEQLRHAMLNTRSAEIMSANVGDVLVINSATGTPHRLVVVKLGTPDAMGSTELAVSAAAATQYGMTIDNRVAAFGITDPAAFDAAVRAAGLYNRRSTKVRGSWERSSPDSTLSTLGYKERLGEPWFRFRSGTSISMHPTWREQNLTPTKFVMHPSIPVRARCHLQAVADFTAAFAELHAAGLGGQINLANTNRYGGCYVPRFIRLSGMPGQLGFLSRHSYGIALDMNTVENCMGCVPKFSCDLVRIFRKHNFAWGGNFRTPDGMHFEWVGERRDQIEYPSKYCPNIVDAAQQRSAALSGEPAPTMTPAKPIGADVYQIGDEHDSDER